jgi:hypothetical protein
MLIAGALAAEQRTVVAHSASYGFSRPQTHQAPVGAKEIYSIAAQIICRAVRRSKNLMHCSHSASYGSSHPQISQAPAGATENHGSTIHFFRPIRGLNHFAIRSHGCHRGLLSRATPWLTQNLLPSFDLWLTRSPIC